MEPLQVVSEDACIKTLLLLSLVPNSDVKIFAQDLLQKTKVELKKLPTFDFYVGLTKAYPSSQGPVFALESKMGFYEPFKAHIFENLS